MAKVVLSNNEFNLLCDTFQAPKQGKHVKWREFVDSVDEVFIKKGLEKRVDLEVEEARTQTLYGRQKPTKAEVNLAEDVVRRFKEMLVRHRLDSKSFFQDWDKHKHFKISPKQFRQVLATFGFVLSDHEIRAVIRTYGNDQDDIMYLNFITDAAPYEIQELNKAISTKTTYKASSLDFKGDSKIDNLMMKIKHQIKKDRIRLGEFFLDFDILRKGSLPAQKFRGVLYT